MSYILDALTRAQALRGQKTAALAHGAPSSPARAWRRRRNLLHIGGVTLLGACALAAGLWAFRAATRTGAPQAAGASAPAQTAASELVPAMAPFPKQQPRAVARFTPPTTLAQPLPKPGSVAAGGAAVPPPPGLVNLVPVDDLKPLSDLPLDLQATISRMRVRVHMVAPQPSHRLVIVDDKQLREGDELLAGVRLDEITEAGLVLRHRQMRVLAPVPTAR